MQNKQTNLTTLGIEAPISIDARALQQLRLALEKGEFNIKITNEDYVHKFIQLRICVYLAQFDFQAIKFLIRRFTNGRLKLKPKLKSYVESFGECLKFDSVANLEGITNVSNNLFTSLLREQSQFEKLLVWNYQESLAKRMTELYKVISLKNFSAFFARKSTKEANRMLMRFGWTSDGKFVTPVSKTEAGKESTKRVCIEQIEIIKKAVSYIESI